MKYCKECGCKLESEDKMKIIDWEMQCFVYVCPKCETKNW